jgi:hypothetical protein
MMFLPDVSISIRQTIILIHSCDLGSASPQLVLEIGELRAGRRLPLIVLPANAQRDTIAFRHDHRCRPYLDGQIDGVAWLQPMHLVVAMVRTVRPRQGFIELAMRGAQPALCHRGVRINRTGKSHLAQVWTENSEHDEDIRVRGAGRNSQFHRERPGDFRLLR